MTASADRELDQLCINTVRTLSIDAVQAASSGHPGTPMGMAPVAYELWQRFLRFDPEDPIWPNRDRFVLSVGHASMLLYSLLHLARVKAVDPDYETLGELSVKLDDIEHFRQLDSKAAGHPEYRWTSGVETTTGPLGQGVATSVGMAIAGRWLAAHFNRPGFELFDYDVYVLAGDGDLMEGVSYEAASIAGHLRLSNLCWIYDDNRVTIDGSTELTFSDDVAARFIAQGWNVMHLGDANDLELARRRLRRLQAGGRAADADRRRQPHRLRRPRRPGHGQGARRAARGGGGAPRKAQLRLARGRAVPDPRRRRRALRRRDRRPRARAAGMPGSSSSSATAPSTPSLRTTSSACSGASCRRAGTATSRASRRTRRAVRDPLGVGAGAERRRAQRSLAGRRRGGPDRLHRHRARFEEAGVFTAADPGGRFLHFGVREHGMAAVVNGLSLSKLRPYGATYLIFSDYATRADPSQRADGDPGDLDLHARLDRPRGGRPDASTRRAARGAAGDPGPGHDPALRRQRGGRRHGEC